MEPMGTGEPSISIIKGLLGNLPIVSIVVPFLVNQNLYYRILTIKLVNQKRELQRRLPIIRNIP